MHQPAPRGTDILNRWHLAETAAQEYRQILLEIWDALGTEGPPRCSPRFRRCREIAELRYLQLRWHFERGAQQDRDNHDDTINLESILEACRPPDEDNPDPADCLAALIHRVETLALQARTSAATVQQAQI
ncbi:MAG: hypothetical protein ACOCX4_00200 [Planctomycetota bacterium]